jgi:hypothetical protein
MIGSRRVVNGPGAIGDTFRGILILDSNQGTTLGLSSTIKGSKIALNLSCLGVM